MFRILILSACFLLLTSCPRKECRVNGGEYDFELSASLSPAQSTYQVGDTISIESVFSNELFDIVTEQLFTLENIRFFPELRIREISSAPAREDGVDDFEVLVEPEYNFAEFRYSDGAVGYTGEYNYSTNEYELEFKLVAQEIGFYLVSFFSLVGNLGEDQEFPGKCNNVRLGANVKLNEGTDNNIGLLANSPDELFNTWVLEKPYERYHQSGRFSFTVE